MKVRKYMLAALVAGGVGGGFLVGRLLAAGIPATSAMTYSGTLVDASGAPLTANQNITINLWSTATPAAGATPLCTVTSSGVKLTAGRFSIPLPDTCTAAVHTNPDVWVDVVVGGMSLGLSKMGAVPYAAEAAHATSADSATNATTAANCPIVTDWQSYTPVLTALNAGTPVPNATSTGKYRRVGDSAEFRVQTTFSSAPNSGATLWAWTLPANMMIDATKFENSTAFIGGGMAQQAANQNVALEVNNRSSTSVSATASGASSYYINDSQPFAWAAAGVMQIYFTVPIVGWTSNK